jgi:hypothetical protein
VNAPGPLTGPEDVHVTFSVPSGATLIVLNVHVLVVVPVRNTVPPAAAGALNMKGATMTPMAAVRRRRFFRDP